MVNLGTYHQRNGRAGSMGWDSLHSAPVINLDVESGSWQANYRNKKKGVTRKRSEEVVEWEGRIVGEKGDRGQGRRVGGKGWVREGGRRARGREGRGEGEIGTYLIWHPTNMELGLEWPDLYELCLFSNFFMGQKYEREGRRRWVCIKARKLIMG